MTDTASGGLDDCYDYASVTVSDATSENDTVIFTIVSQIRSKSSASTNEVTVTRLQEDFQWLYHVINANENHMGLIVPPPPPPTDFTSAYNKLLQLNDDKGRMQKEEYEKLKTEVEFEFLLAFKKALSMYQIFIQRLTGHPVFQRDTNLQRFLQNPVQLTPQERALHLQNAMSKITSWMQNVKAEAVSRLKSQDWDSPDPQLRQQTAHLPELHATLRSAAMTAGAMVVRRRNCSEDYVGLSVGFYRLSTFDHLQLVKIHRTLSELFLSLQKREIRTSADEELHLVDPLHYCDSELISTRELLARRRALLARFDSANHNLERVRRRGNPPEVIKAEEDQAAAFDKFQAVTDSAKPELEELTRKRGAYMKERLVVLAEKEINHAKANLELFQTILSAVRSL